MEVERKTTMQKSNGKGRTKGEQIGNRNEMNKRAVRRRCSRKEKERKTPQDVHQELTKEVPGRKERSEGTMETKAG